MTCTRVYLMRHGEVLNAGEMRYNGHIDVDITANGVEQMRRLAEMLAGKPVAAIYTSDLTRSAKGGAILSERLGVASQPVRELRERSVGAWEGMTSDEIRQRYPAEYEAWRRDLLNYRPPGGECLMDVRDRILPAYRRLVASHPGQEIGVLLHGGVNRIILADAIGFDLGNLFRIEQSFGALNVIDYFDGDMAVVRLVNG